jgi:hypothetical protein
MTGKNAVLGYSSRIGLSRILITSAFHHLSPNLASRPTLSVVGTCWAAKGLMGAMARFRAADL